VASKPDSDHAKVYRALADKVWTKVEKRLVDGQRTAPKIVMQ